MNVRMTLLVIALPLVARADDDAHVKAVPMTAAADACDGILAATGIAHPEAATCKRLASKKVKGVGTAMLYAATNLGGGQQDWTKYVLAIDDGSGTVQLSQAIDVSSEGGMAGQSDTLGKVTPKLRAVHVGGDPAAAVELTIKMTHQHVSHHTDSPAEKTPWTRHVVLACGKNDQNDWRCAIGDYGTNSQSCSVKLDAAGTITYACGTTATLSFL